MIAKRRVLSIYLFPKKNVNYAMKSNNCNFCFTAVPLNENEYINEIMTT